MNERIFELAKQAEIKFEEHLQHIGIDTAVITTADLKKFAELIIHECVVMAKGFEFAVQREGLSEAMKQHFGVKND
jgi:hypothetical protein